ncbi:MULTISPECIES: type II toxin-antitoxin system HicB family antitoxin [Snodgrassella]|uniref:type II toxin-antitoxin system HicB family antitoxin n=1 Tax=Snodgrassella TaxID=1193515 RepID=UPI0009B848FA|nr:type II toxin-antitoxin system HicB family antitoxin [Snodgrassella sp. W6238H11]MBI0161757.1 type II toxin-antitoxin system HicB family antitoxin [Snodgrassella sp. W6238H14]
MTNTKEAIQFHLESILEDGEEPVIEQISLDNLINNSDYAGAQWFGVEMNIDHLTFNQNALM